jgi:hypothetical protein
VNVQLANKPLILDLMEWIERQPRTYTEVMDAWRTSCPRLPVWEDSLDHGLVVCERRDGAGTVVTLTEAGRAFLDTERPKVDGSG